LMASVWTTVALVLPRCRVGVGIDVDGNRERKEIAPN